MENVIGRRKKERETKMKILFLSAWDIKNSIKDGGIQCSFRNYQAICSYFGKENVAVLSVAMQQRFRFLNLFNRKEIIENAKNKQFIFIDHSSFGSLARSIKKVNPNAKIITFFHDVEYDWYKENYSKKIIRKIIIRKIIFKNELIACTYSDYIISLNSRDMQRIEKLYNRKPDIIPISFPNIYIDFNKSAIPTMPIALFLGSNVFPNIHGITWLIENVLPFVNIKLRIVGKNMNKANLPKNDKLEVLGYVEDLNIVMQNADFMIFPIFQGSGMKVKTCEALMHGKNIIGTSESFQGYDVDFEKVGACCETAEEFIAAINEFSKRFNYKFNQYSRDLFLKKYNDEIIFEKFADVFRGLEELMDMRSTDV
jgi:hypothetical protein